MQLMLVNPSKRKPTRKKTMRTAKQKAATRKLVAFNRRRAKAKRNPAPRRKAPARRKTVARKSPVRRRTTTTTIARRRPARRVARKRRYNSNPARRSAKLTIRNVVDQQIRPAAIQASGALMLDIGYGYFGSYIPATFNTGMLKHATKGVIAVGMGMLASNFMNNATANKLALGAMTVTFHDALKEAMTTFMPGIPMGEYGYYNASPVVGGDMGYFSNDSGQGIGYFSNDAGQGYAGQHAAFDTSDNY